MTIRRKHPSQEVIRFALGAFLLSSQIGVTGNPPLLAQSLEIRFSKLYGQVEVGGPYVGIEFHESRPLPSRISFYYPVANSIDLSTDYWHRADSRPLFVNLSTPAGGERAIGSAGWSYVLSPHRVTFHSRDNELEYSIEYEFCLNEPAMVFSLAIRNMTSQTLPVQVSTSLALVLRTCQTYAWRDSSRISFDSPTDLFSAQYDQPDTHKAAVFIQNAGVRPSSWKSSKRESGNKESQGRTWNTAEFGYRKSLVPGDSLLIIQIIGSSKEGEVEKHSAVLAQSWRKEVESYDRMVRSYALNENRSETGDALLDASAAWARGILTSNAHYLDGAVVPMPCPAEYNFFFTHDLLLTDLAASQFDLARVKRDLLYLLRHAREGVIPHAYYWRDNGFKTEWCAPDNWNHLWFVLVSARYLRHSFDEETGLKLFPLLTRSINDVLTKCDKDFLMHAAHPDWWDIGNWDGSRAYLTSLTLKAIRGYLFIASSLHRFSPRLAELEQTAAKMEEALVRKLWDQATNYLTNFNGAGKDHHFYAGSILAVAEKILDQDRSKALMARAERELVVPSLGVRTVMPADFHRDSVISLYRLAGKEGGDEFVYINGGVWPHCNAWYVMGLQAIGQSEEALRFYRMTMTLDGILRSPMGQPAMYEYRFTDSRSPEFGKIDKPSFLWAAGFTLNALYRLLAVGENDWNCSLASDRADTGHDILLTYAFGSARELRVTGSGRSLKALRAGSTSIPSLVFPKSMRGDRQVEAEFGSTERPYLEGVNAILEDISITGKELQCVLSSFERHQVRLAIISPTPIRAVMLNGKKISSGRILSGEGRLLQTEIIFAGSNIPQKLSIRFE